MYSINYRFFKDNILRGILLRKYNFDNCMEIPKLSRIVLTLELKDKEDLMNLDNFLALNILTYIARSKSSCTSHNVRYKLGQKHTFIFQVILRKSKLNRFLNFFCLNSIMLVSKKQLDFKVFVNNLHNSTMLISDNLSFFSQLPVEYFKWNSGIKIEFSAKRLQLREFKINDLTCYLNYLNNKFLNENLKKHLFYNEIYNDKG